MKALVIYDLTGYIWNIVYGADKEPEGLLCMWVDIPEGANITKIDVSDPENHQPVFTYNDNSDIKRLEAEIAEVKESLNPTLDTENCTLDEAKEYMLSQFSKTCTALIEEGQEVETSKGTYSFSFTVYDQINLKEVFDLAYLTGLDMPYHANKVDCTMWSALDIVMIYGSNVYAKTYQTTYCNLLNNICRALETKEDVLAMTYGMELPDEQKQTIDFIMNETQKVFDKVVSDFKEKYIIEPDTTETESSEVSSEVSTE